MEYREEPLSSLSRGAIVFKRSVFPEGEGCQHRTRRFRIDAGRESSENRMFEISTLTAVIEKSSENLMFNFSTLIAVIEKTSAEKRAHHCCANSSALCGSGHPHLPHGRENTVRTYVRTYVKMIISATTNNRLLSKRFSISEFPLKVKQS